MTKTFSYQNHAVFYRVYGQGKPVFLLHGFGEDGEVWKNQVESLKNQFRLIVPDLPGSGLSETIDDMSIEGLADAVHAIIHEENIESCTVIGHSMGGYITLALVDKYWNHVNGFGLFHSSSFADTEEKKANRQKGIGFIKEHGGFDFLKTMIPNLYSAVTKDKKAGLIDEHLAGVHNFSGDTLVLYYEAMIRRPDRTSLLRKAAVPVLFVMGKYDTAVPVEDCLQQCHLPEKSYIHMLQQSGHMGMKEEAEKSNILLRDFLVDI